MSEALVPTKSNLYVPCGNYADVKAALLSKKFYPIFVTGLSGNGKTTMVEQVCADLGRPMIRVNITCETDEDDLLGGFRLKDGNTVWQNGPIVDAMIRGDVVLLDEVDLASNKIMCLQPVLEGKGIYLKKIGQHITPKAGFMIVATANTKGQGSESGKYIGTNVLNEAFLDRFATTMEQSYPEPKVETKILDKILAASKVSGGDFTECLVKWANATRQNYEANDQSEVISTRRLVHIVNAFAIYGDRLKSVSMSLTRFDDTTRRGFQALYCAHDASVRKPEDTAVVTEPVAVAVSADTF